VAVQTVEIRVLDKTQRALSNISQRLTNLNKGLLGVNRVAGLAATALGAIGGANLIRNIVTTTTRFEDLQTTLNTVAGSAKAGAEAFDFITQFSTKTQFGVEELTNTYIKLQTAGIKPTEELLTLFTDAAAVTTDQLGSLQAITDLFSRTTAGGLGLEELNRLADRGIPVFDILQQKLGRNRLQLSDLGKTAEGANVILTALTDGIRERFGGATEARLANTSVAFSNLQIAIQNAQFAIGKQGFNKALGDTAKSLTDYIENNKEAVREIGINLTKAFLFAKEAMILVIKNIDLIGKAFAAFFALKITVALGSIAFAFGSHLVKGIVLATRAIKTMTLVAAANPLIAGALILAAGVEYLTGAFSKLAEKMNIGGVADAALDKLENGFNAVGEKISENIVGLDEFNQAMGNINEKANQLAIDNEKINQELEAQKENANKVNEATSGTGQNLKEQADKLVSIKTTYEQILQKATENHAMAKTALITDEAARKIKIAEIQLGRELTAQEKIRLELKYKGTQAANKELELMKQVESASTSLIEKTILFRTKELEILEAGKNRAIELLQEELDSKQILLEDFNTRKLELETIFQDEVKRLNEESLAEQDRQYENSIRHRLATSKNLIQEQLTDKEKEFLQRKGYEERQQEIANKRIEFEKKSEREKAQFAIGQIADTFEALGKYNKKAFQAAKAMRIAEAIMNTYQGATKALATYPPPFNFIAAAAVVAAGLANVATIRSQQYTGRQRGGALNLNQPTVVGEDGPELIVPKQRGTVIPREVATALEDMNGGGNGPVNVNFNITTTDARGFDQLLVERRSTIVGIINQAMNSRGKTGVTV
jgi:hypothetical protein